MNKGNAALVDILLLRMRRNLYIGYVHGPALKFVVSMHHRQMFKYLLCLLCIHVFVEFIVILVFIQVRTVTQPTAWEDTEATS